MFGNGYPPHREDSQQQSRRTLEAISVAAHKPFGEIVASLPDDVIETVLTFPGAKDLTGMDSSDKHVLIDGLGSN